MFSLQYPYGSRRAEAQTRMVWLAQSVRTLKQFSADAMLCVDRNL